MKKKYTGKAHLQDHDYLKEDSSSSSYPFVPQSPVGPTVFDQSESLVFKTQAYIDSKRAQFRSKVSEKGEAFLKVKKALELSKRAVKRLQKKLLKKDDVSQKEKMKQALETLREFVSPSVMIHIENSVKNLKVHKKGRRYTTHYKTLLLAIHQRSTQAYRFLQKKFNLPPESTVASWLRGIKIGEGFSEAMLKLLSDRIKTLSERDRQVVLSMDDMSIQSSIQYHQGSDKVVGVASTTNGQLDRCGEVCVFQINGIFKKFRQPILYKVSKGGIPGSMLKDLVTDTLTKLTSIGFRVRLITTDQGSNFMKLMELLGASFLNPFFEHQGQRIYFMNDIPHCIKNVRNLLLNKKIIRTPEGDVEWHQFRALFDLDQKNKVRMCPRLTSRHIFVPPGKPRMNVRLAMQLLSHSSYVAFTSHMKKNNLAPSYAAPAEFCFHLNNITDILNSGIKYGTNIYKHALSKEFPAAIQYLKDAKEWLGTWTILKRKNDGTLVDVSGSHRCVRGLIGACTVVPMLLDDLEKDVGASYILTRRLNQDALENLFSLFRQNLGNNRVPHCSQLDSVFKTSAIH